MEKGAQGKLSPMAVGGEGLTPQYRGEPRGNPPRTVWSAEREEHEQVMGKPSTCLAHIELKWIPGVTFCLEKAYKTGQKSLSVF